MELFYIILVLLVATRVCGELVARLGFPELVGQLLGGIFLGVLVNQYSEMFPVLAELSDNEVFHALTELGVFFLMLMGGLEMHPVDLKKSSVDSFWIALSGLVIPLGGGLLLGWVYLPDSDWKVPQMLFLGTAMAITAIPVAVKVLLDLNQLNTKIGKLIVSSALYDDIFGLILLGILTGLLNSGEVPGPAGIGLLFLQAIGFMAVAAAIGIWLIPFLSRKLKRLWIEELEFTWLLVVALSLSLLAEAFGLHFILGAFLAGLFFTNRTFGTETFKDVESKVNGVGAGFLAPLFFASIGLHLEVSALWNVPGFVFLLIFLAIFTKLIGAGLASKLLGHTNREASGIGVAMSARGAVELIIAGIALEAGLFSVPEPVPPIVSNLFSAVVIMAIVTTLLMPIGLRLILREKDNQT